MDYKVLYNVEFGNMQFLLLIIPITFILIGVIAARLIKRYGFSLPIWFPRLYPQNFMNNYARFFSIMTALFGFIIMVVFLVKLPISYLEKKEIQAAIENGDVLIVEGRIKNFSPPDDKFRDSESFIIDGIEFEYSDYLDTYGYHKTSVQGGVIISNNQLVRITYLTLKGEKIILKIEGQ